MIYLDNAATTPVCSSAKNAIINHFNDFANPSSQYEAGRQARCLVEEARAIIAKCINANHNEIVFTSGGAEANSWITSKYMTISSRIEHHSLKAHYDKVVIGNNGVIDPQHFSCINHSAPSLFEMMSCMYVNNEIGTIQPIKEIAEVAHRKNMLFHTDAVQAVGHINIDVKDLQCDFLSASGHKFGAPKGVGFLYVREGINLDRLIFGGKQENGLRGGTENVLGIIAMAAALEESTNSISERNVHISYLRDKMLHLLLKVPGAKINGSIEHRSVSNINICFNGVLGSRLVTLCDMYGVCISAGSACNEGAAEPSHVLKAIGLSDEDALNSVRITIGHENTEEEINTAAQIITKLIERIRNDG